MVQKSGKLTSWGWLFIPFKRFYTSQVVFSPDFWTIVPVSLGYEAEMQVTPPQNASFLSAGRSLDFSRDPKKTPSFPTRDGIPRFANVRKKLGSRDFPRESSILFTSVWGNSRHSSWWDLPRNGPALTLKGPFTAVDGRNPAITTCDVEHPVNNEIFTIATGEFAEFLNHQQCHLTRPLWRVVVSRHLKRQKKKIANHCPKPLRAVWANCAGRMFYPNHVPQKTQGVVLGKSA